MNIERDPAAFRPLTIRLEDQDELDMLLAVLTNVAENRVNHTPPVVRAAATLLRDLKTAAESD